MNKIGGKILSLVLAVCLMLGVLPASAFAQEQSGIITILSDENTERQDAESEAEPEPATEAMTEPEPATEAVTEPKPATEAVTEPKPATEAVTEPEPATEAVTEPKPATEAVTEPEPATEAVTSTEASAASNDPIVFKDPNFKAAILAAGIGADGEITYAQAAAATSLHVVARNISSLDGIEYFTSLTYLSCEGNQLTSLDISKNTALTEFRCGANQLTSLDVSKNTALQSLSCSLNKLTELDVSENTALKGLYCGQNPFSTLDLSKNTALENLTCYYNELTELDLSNNLALRSLMCYGGSLTSINVSKNTALTKLNCYNNQLTALDVSKNTALTELICYSNQLTALDVSNNTALTKLDCYNNQLTALDVSKNTALTYLDFFNNQLTTLDVSKNTALTYLDCYNNQLTALDVSNNTALTHLDCSWNKLTALNTSSNLALTYLDCYNNQLTALDVSNNTALTHLDCSWNKLTALNTSSNLALTYLDCSVNKLTALNVSYNSALSSLYCAFNKMSSEAAIIGLNKSLTTTFSFNPQNSDDPIFFPDSTFKEILLSKGIGSYGEITPAQAAEVTELSIMGGNYVYDLTGIEYFTSLTRLSCSNTLATSLDVSNCAELTYLDCRWNELTSLDVSKNIALTRLECNNNQLTSLDVSKNTALTNLICYNNQLTSLDVSKNTALTSLECGNNKLTALDVSKNTALTWLTCETNQLTAFDVTKNTALKTLICSDNQLSSLDVSKNTALETLFCGENRLTSLDVTKNTVLDNLECNDNKLTSLNLLNNSSLWDLRCDNNQLTVLDVSNNPSLWWLYCSNNKLTSLDLSNNESLMELDCRYNYMVSESDIIGLDKSVTIVFYFDPQNIDTSDKVTSVTITPKTVTVQQGGTQQFAANVTAVGDASTAVNWRVTGKKHSSTSISTNGLLTVAPAETAITLTVTATSTFDNTKTDTAAVTVIPDPNAPAKLELSPKTLTVNIGDNISEKLTMKLLKPNGDVVTDATKTSVIWESNNKNVATITNGVVKAINAGSTTITARSGHNNSISDYCWITVRETSAPTQIIEITSTPGVITPNPDKNNSYTISGRLTDTKDAPIILEAGSAVTWKTNDVNVAAIKIVDGKAQVTYKGAGTATITATSTADKTKSSTVVIKVADVKPKVSVAALTVYNKSTTGTAFEVLSSDNFTFDTLQIHKALDNKNNDVESQFSSSGSGANWKLISTAPKGTYTVTLQAVNTASPDNTIGFFDLKVTVLDSMPTAKLKLTALNTFWKKAEGEITITGSNLPEIEEITPLNDLGVNFQIEKRTDGKFYVTATKDDFKLDINNNPIVTGNIEIKYAGIDDKQTQNITIPIKPVPPKLTLSPATQTINKEFGLDATVQVIGGIVEKVDTNPTFEGNSAIEETIRHTGNAFTVTLKANATPTNALQLNVTLDGARTSILVKPTVKTVADEGSFKLSAGTLTFLTKDAKKVQKQTVKLMPTVANADASVAEPIPITEGAPLDIFERKGTELTVTVKPDTATGTHKYKIRAAGVKGEQTLTVKVYQNKTLVATVKAEKGNIDLMNRDGTKLTYVPAIKNTQAYISDVEFITSTTTGNASAVAAAKDNYDRAKAKLGIEMIDGKAVATVKPDAEIIKGEAFKIKLQFKLADGNSAETGVLTIKPTQSAVKHSIPKNLTMYQSRTGTDVSNHIIVDLMPLTPTGAKIETLGFKEEKWDKGGTPDDYTISKYTKNPGNAYWYSFDPFSQKLHIWIKDGSLVKPGKAALTFSATYTGQGFEKYKTVNGVQIGLDKQSPKPIDIKILVTIVR